MTRTEALEILALDGEINKELLRLNYHKKFVDRFRKKSAALTHDEVEKWNDQLHKLNEAFCLIDGTEVHNAEYLQLDFRFREFDKEEIMQSQKDERKEMSAFVQKMMHENREGLALSLLEMSISLCAKESSSYPQSNLRTLLPLMGNLLLEIGLVKQGMNYLNFGKTSFEKALNLYRIGDYKMAAHYFAMELKLGESGIKADELCQRIAICYFLLNEYENATNIIEEVLPKLLPKKQIFEQVCESKSFATAMMISIYRLDDYKGKKVDAIKLRLKYPLCFKYLQNCYGKIETAWKVIQEFEKSNQAYEDFMKDLKPKSFIRERVNMDYDEEEISQLYLNLFEEPIQRSLIYHPKEKSH